MDLNFTWVTNKRCILSVFVLSAAGRDLVMCYHLSNKSYQTCKNIYNFLIVKTQKAETVGAEGDKIF